MAPSLFLLSEFTRRSFESTLQTEFSMKVLFESSDILERELKLRNVQLLGQ